MGEESSGQRLIVMKKGQKGQRWGRLYFLAKCCGSCVLQPLWKHSKVIN